MSCKSWSLGKSFLACGALLLAASSVFAITRQDEGEGRMQVFPQNTERKASRVLFFDGNGIPAQFTVDYAPPEWKPEYERQATAAPAGTRMRFGKDAWTSLDTNVSLNMGDATVEPGHYYVVLEKGEGDGWNLVFVDSDEVRAQKFDAFQSEETTGGTSVSMNTEKLEESASTLSFQFVVKDGAVTLEVLWGPYRLTTPVAADV